MEKPKLTDDEKRQKKWKANNYTSTKVVPIDEEDVMEVDEEDYDENRTFSQPDLTP